MGDPTAILVYTDGSCLKPHGPGGWAAIIFENDSEEADVVEGYEKNTTNNRMELTAILAGLEFAMSLESKLLIMVYTDSEYALNVSTGSKRAVENLDLVSSVREIFDNNKHRIQFVWVRGHNGDRWNEFVDSASRLQAEKARDLG